MADICYKGLTVIHSVDILKNSEFCFREITKCINKAFNGDQFDILRVIKKLDTTDKINFRPVRLLPLLSKMFERIM